MLDISNSYIYLYNNALAFLFDEIQYEMGGELGAKVRKPGITSAMKIMMSYGSSQSNVFLGSGWGLTEQKHDILDESSHILSGKLPLKYLMGFAEDYTKGVLNAKQELILIY